MRTRRLVVAFVVLAIPACSRSPRGACVSQPPPGTVGTICGFANPEDVEPIPSAGIVLVSNMRQSASSGGFLAALPLDAGAQAAPRRLWPAGAAAADNGVDATHPAIGDPHCVEPPAAEVFAPHGITSLSADVAGVVRIAAVGHGGRQAIELFDLTGTGDGARLAWRGCVLLPPHTVANDVSIAADGEIVASNYMPSMDGMWSVYYTVKSGLGGNTGDVIAWRRGTGWRHLSGTAAPCPNGVLVSPDGAYVFYAETGSGRVARVPRAGLTGDQRPDFATIGGNPDNLWLSPRGTILAATHTDGAAFLLCAFGQLPCRTGWSIFEIDPVTLHATQVLHHDGTAVGAVASAAEVGDRLYFGAVFDDRIGVWRRPR